MTLVATHNLQPGHVENSQQVYNALDCCLTYEVHEVLSTLRNELPTVYNFERALQAPAMEMMLRGFRIDEGERQKGIALYKGKIAFLQEQLNILAAAVWGKGLNPNSPKQLIDFFYGEMRLPVQYRFDHGQRKVSTNREALEKLELHFHARPIIATILALRDCSKRLSVLETEVDQDGRMRTSYNIAGTETWRFSSSSNSTGTGTNLQNIAPDLRKIFVADPGYKICGIDLEQAESREVAWLCGTLFNDWSYLNACYCLTSDHEVLTPNGWTSIATKPEVIASYLNGEIGFERVPLWNECVASELIEIEAPALSVKGTLNHKMPVFGGKFNDIPTTRTLEQIRQSPNYKFPIHAEFRGGSLPIPDAALRAAFQADGTRDAQGRVHFTFSKVRKIILLRQLLDQFGLRYSEYALGNGNTRFYLRQGQFHDHWNKVCGKEILSWDLQSLQSFCESHAHWDGHTEGKMLRIVAKSLEHIQWLATAYTLIGKNVSLNIHKRDYYVLAVKSAVSAGYRCAQFTKHQGQFKVYCPTTTTGFFLIRRNNKISISGNSGDLHTLVCKANWKHLPWTGDAKEDRKIADGIAYREYSYRDLAKKLSHGSNYYGQPFTMARHAKVPKDMVESFQREYFTRFPGIQKWHRWTAQQLQTTNSITTPFGVRRHFFGRPGDDTTLREAIAFSPQSSTALRLNLILWRIWKHMGTRVQILAQVHDALYMQIPIMPPEAEASLITEALGHFRIEMKSGDRELIVPGECKLGYNWANYDPDKNPDGLKKYKPGTPDLRTRTPALPAVPILDRLL